MWGPSKENSIISNEGILGKMTPSAVTPYMKRGNRKYSRDQYRLYIVDWQTGGSGGSQRRMIDIFKFKPIKLIKSYWRN